MPPTACAGRWLTVAFWSVALVVCLGVVAQASYAAFTAKVSNSSNSFGVGRVALADDDSGSALLTLSGLRPGSSGTRCIAVTSTGTLPSNVKLYATSAATTKALSTYLTLVISQGTGGDYDSCAGFSALSSNALVYSGTLTNFSSTATSYGTGLGSWTPSGSGNETRTFQFTYTLLTTTPDTAQGGTADLGLTWETQNT